MNSITETRHHLQVAQRSDRARLNRFLAETMPAFSRSRLKALIETGQVSISGETITEPAYRVKPGQAITLSVPPPVDDTPRGQDIPLAIAYEVYKLGVPIVAVPKTIENDLKHRQSFIG